MSDGVHSDGGQRMRSPLAQQEEENMASAFAKKLADVALDQHAQFQFMDETDTKLCKQIQEYWKGISPGFSSCSAVPWSAVFVSFCVKKAGATSSEFKFAASHSTFVHNAINKPGGAFQGLEITAHGPEVGDIIQNNREGAKHDFAHAKANASYASHSAIVIEVGEDTDGRFAFTVGGNEGDSIRRKRVQLDKKGFIKQRTDNPFICVLKNVK
jgi:hypothetical protein